MWRGNTVVPGLTNTQVTTILKDAYGIALTRKILGKKRQDMLVLSDQVLPLTSYVPQSLS